MKKLAASICALLFLCQTCFAQISVDTRNVKTVTKITPTIVTQVLMDDGTALGDPSTTTGETVVKEGRPAILMMLETTRPIGELLIKPKCKTAKVEELEPGFYIVSEPGKHEIEFNAIGQNPLTWDDKTIVVEVSGDVPTPVEPDDDEPEVGKNLRVLFVVESAELSTLPQSQHSILSSGRVAEYLNEKCVKVDGQPEWRVWDNDSDASCDTEKCKMLRAYQAETDDSNEAPVILIKNDKASYSGPLPASVDEFMDLVRKYGG